MRKLILPIALASAALATAADIELHGELNADYATYFDDDFDPTNAANQDIDLSATAHLDEYMSVKVMTNTHSTYVTKDSTTDESETRRHYMARSTAMGDDGSVTAFNFDGVQFRWDISHAATFLVGDMTYSAGSFNYYYWRDTKRYAVITREEKLRGIGVEVGNEKYGQGAAYIGASDRNDHTLASFATYSLPLLNHVDEHLVITPSVDWLFGQHIGRSYTYTFGTEVDYSKSFEVFNYGIYAVWGLHPYKGNGVHSFLIEPSMNVYFFNLSMSYFYALVDEDYEAAPQLLTDDQMLFSIEPSFNLHKKLTMGFNYEYHDPDKNISGDDYQFLGMSFYVYPTMKTELVFWYGYNFTDRDDIDTDFAMGISAKASF